MHKDGKTPSTSKEAEEMGTGTPYLAPEGTPEQARHGRMYQLERDIRDLRSILGDMEDNDPRLEGAAKKLQELKTMLLDMQPSQDQKHWRYAAED